MLKAQGSACSADVEPSSGTRMVLCTAASPRGLRRFRANKFIIRDGGAHRKGIDMRVISCRAVSNLFAVEALDSADGNGNEGDQQADRPDSPHDDAECGSPHAVLFRVALDL